MKRSAFLIVGLSILLPYLAGVLGHVTAFDIDNRPVPGQLVGAIPGFFAVEIPPGVGVAGAVLLGFLALSALTLATFAWHPLQRLERHPDEPAAPLKGEAAKSEPKRKAGALAKPARGAVRRGAADQAARRGQGRPEA